MNLAARKAWCRRAFLVLCAAPTLLVACWIGWNAILGDAAAGKRDWERALSSRLGMKVQIGTLDYPQPELAVLSQVEIADAETGQVLARAAALEVTKSADVWQIEALSPEVEGAHISRLSERLHERLLCGGNQGEAAFTMFAREMTLLDGAASHTLSDVQAEWEPADSGPTLTASFRWPEGADQAGRIVCTLQRNRRELPPATELSIDTTQAAIPCRLAAKFWPRLNGLGTDAEFAGKANAVLGIPATVELSGALRNIDLDALVSEQFSQILSGTADIELDGAAINGGRLSSAAGTIAVSRGGRISRSLLLAAEEHLGLDTPVEASGSDVLPYGRLEIGFRVEGTRLHLTGLPGASGPEVLIAGRSGPLLTAPKGHQAQAVGLARTLLPDSSLQVPLASQTAELVQLFPAPAPAGGPRTASRSHVPARLAPGGPSRNVIRER